MFKLAAAIIPGPFFELKGLRRSFCFNLVRGLVPMSFSEFQDLKRCFFQSSWGFWSRVVLWVSIGTAAMGLETHLGEFLFHREVYYWGFLSGFRGCVETSNRPFACWGDEALEHHGISFAPEGCQKSNFNMYKAPARLQACA